MTAEESKVSFEAMRRETAESVEALIYEIRLLAESIRHLDEKFDRTRESLEQKIDTSAAETRAMLKFL